MSHLNENQPYGTPTWVDLAVPDLDAAKRFYGALFGWEFSSAPPEFGSYTTCLLDGRRAAALVPATAPSPLWTVYLATDDCDDTVRRVRDAGGTVIEEPDDVPGKGRMAMVADPTGAPFGLWQGRGHTGCEVVNEPNSLVRNDLVTSDPESAREFYATVFDFTLDRNDDLPDFDFTFLRRPDGHEVAGIFGDPGAVVSRWSTTFEVANTDEAVERALAAGGQVGHIEDMVYGRIAVVTDPFGTEISIIARPT